MLQPKVSACSAVAWPVVVVVSLHYPSSLTPREGGHRLSLSPQSLVSLAPDSSLGLGWAHLSLACLVCSGRPLRLLQVSYNSLSLPSTNSR